MISLALPGRILAARLSTVPIVVLVLLALAARAQATFPGANGKIAFVRGGDVWAMNPDGTGQLNLTNDSARQGAPSWSPDGARIAFNQFDSSSQAWKAWTMSADGTNRVIADDGSPCCVARYDPAWSPDGTRIAFATGNALYTMDPDGSHIFGLATAPE